MGSKIPYAIQAFLRLKTPGLMRRYVYLSQSYVRSAALSLDKELPLLPEPSIPTALVAPATEAGEPITIPNNQPQPTSTTS
jgi:hypothetical protein